MSDQEGQAVVETQSTQQEAIKFCPICGTQMTQESPYGFLCWVCPECDYIEPI